MKSLLIVIGGLCIEVKVYKTKESLSENTIIERLIEEDYREVGETIEHDTAVISILVEKKNKDTTSWIREVIDFFEIEEDLSNGGLQVNAVIVVKIPNNIFLVPKGRAYHKILEMIDLDFGMDFAERAIDPTNIDVKGVSFIQRNKKRGVTDYKENSTEFAQASESYFSVSGKPDYEYGYGKSIDCGNAVSIGRRFPLRGPRSRQRRESVANFVQLFFDIEETLERRAHSEFPRAVRIKEQNQIDELDDNLLEAIDDEENLYLSIDTNRIQLFDDNIFVVNNDFKITIYIVHHKQNTSREVELNDSSIVEYIKDNYDVIESLDNLRFELTFENGSNTPITKSFKQLVHCEMEYDDTVYLLENGSWQYLNESFINLVDEKLDDIVDFVAYQNEFDEISENSSDHTEDEFINEAYTNYNYIKLHKRLINKNNIKAEIADLYSAEKDELFAIKRSIDTSKSIYSLAQTNLGIQALKQPRSFSVKEELLKYNEAEKFEGDYSIISEEEVEEILKCKNYSVLWLIEESDPAYVKEGVENRNFQLSQFNSLLLKLQIIDFYDLSVSNEFTPKIYFSFTGES